jgi:hypothetical protein
MPAGPTTEWVEALVAELYAGFAAEILLAPDHEEEARIGRSSDDVKADRFIEWLGGDSDQQEARLRAKAAQVVEEHWPAIERIAAELIEHRVLDDTEVETLIEIAEGSEDVTEADLATYRRIRPVLTAEAF